MKVLASDFDNTLFFPDDKIITNKNVEAIKQFVIQGNIFCLITGRSYMEIKEELVKLELPYTYLVCADGAMIFDSTDYCLKTVKLNKEVVHKVNELLKEKGYNPYLEDGYNITTNLDDCIKIAAEYTDKELATKTVEEINKNYNVYAYLSRKHINVNHITNNKKEAILRVAEVANISPYDFNVIGDGINDYEMLQTFNGGLVKKYSPVLNKLNLPIYNSLYEYIDFLLKN